MTSDKKFGLLRNLLQAIGLSQAAADDVVDFIVALLAGEGKGDATPAPEEFPYLLRDDFLSAAELSYFKVLQSVVGEQALLFTKVNLSDLFWVKSDDRSQFRVYTNKIDRKHVDFLLCDPATLRPLVGIELDDKSHQRPDRQERDAFVDEVFKAAGLPLLHVPVKRAYPLADIAAQVVPYLNRVVTPASGVTSKADSVSESPRCPKCGGEMILRTAKKGANAGGQFWGCSNYPQCRGMVEV